MLGISPAKMLLLRMKGAVAPGRLSGPEKLLLLLHQGKSMLGRAFPKAPSGALKQGYWALLNQSHPGRISHLSGLLRSGPKIRGK